MGPYIAQKAEKKVQLGIYAIENPERRFSMYLLRWKYQSKERLEISFTEKVKIRYSFVPNCTWGLRGGGWGVKQNVADRKLSRFFKKGQLLLVHL